MFFMRTMRRTGRLLLWAMSVAAGLVGACGCVGISGDGDMHPGGEHGKTWYVGGAGPIGTVVGAADVPQGLRNAGYEGAIEVFGWQTETLRDQVDRSRNERQAQRLAERILAFLEEHPDGRANIIGLSAGTGIVTWALESLPEDVRVGTVVYLGSSMSRRYDLSRALQRIDGHLYCFHSPHDKLLRFGVSLAGTVDRKPGSNSVAGLYGFGLPPSPEQDVLQLYRDRLRNRSWKRAYRRYGYHGAHTDSTKPRFIEKVVAPLLEEPLRRSGPRPAGDVAAETQPAGEGAQAESSAR